MNDLAEIKAVLGTLPASRSHDDCAVINLWLEDNTSFTKDLSEKKLADFAKHATYAHYGPDEWIVQQDQHADKFFIALAGTMEVFVADYNDGKPINIIGAGQGFGEVGLLRHGHKRSASVLTKSAVELMQVEHLVFKHVFASHFTHLGIGIGFETLEEVVNAHRNEDVSDRQKATKALRHRLNKDRKKDDVDRSTSMRRTGRKKLHERYLEGKGDVKKPSHKLAQAFYKENVMPKRLEMRDSSGNLISYRLAMPHERHLGKPYNYWTTGPADFAQFSLGVGLYFYLLKGLFVLCFALFFLYIPVINHYRSPKYSSKQFPISLTGSAVCMRRVEVALAPSTIITLAHNSKGDNNGPATGYFNDCPLSENIAYIVLASFAVVSLFVTTYSRAQQQLAEKIDVSVQTLQDYSLVVTDPDPDACDPDEWQRFFAQFGEVAVVTIHKNNGDLLHNMAKRETIMRQIDFETGQLDCVRLIRPEDHLSGKARQLLQKLGFCRDLLYWQEKLEEMNEVVNFLIKKKYTASIVFVTFEHEQGQRNALRTLSTGLIQAITNRSTWTPKNQLFRGTNILAVEESPEHGDIIYEKMGLTDQTDRYIAFFFMLCLSVSFLIVSVLGVMAFRGWPNFVGLIIAFSNALFPEIINIGVTKAPYDTYSEQQVGVFQILCVVRIANSVFLAFFVQDFTSTLSVESIQQIESILLTDAIVLPLLSLYRPLDIFKRNVLSRFAATQAQANAYCSGEEVTLARKYSNMIKTLALALVYAPIYPFGLMLTALSFLATYCVDKWCLLRKWREIPHVDQQLPFATVNFLVIIALMHVLMANYYFSAWGFDNVCLFKGSAGNATFSTAEGLHFHYQFCRKEPAFMWPEVHLSSSLSCNTPSPLLTLCTHAHMHTHHAIFAQVHKWMGPEQTSNVVLFRVVCVGTVSAAALWGMLFSSNSCYHMLFHSTYASVGDSQDIPFSSVEADM
jgi:CRP-like cAMP-binding protein